MSFEPAFLDEESATTATSHVKQEPTSRKIWRFILDTFETLLLALLLFLAINSISARVRVDGYSMRPTLDNGQYVLVNRLAYRFGKPQRGDIIVFHNPNYVQEDFIKRVIGLPGDTIRIMNGVVQINGYTLKEPYIAEAPLYHGEWRVPEGALFVLGDNRNDSSDSHAWGTLDMKYVIGKAVLIYWPFSDAKILSHPDLIPEG